MAAVNTMVKQCAGLVGTRDVTPWEDDFLRSIIERSQDSDRPDLLSPKQIETLERIHGKHFA